jgi:predicted nuclease of restriction endonuclease-like (RecB) superfamily
LSNIFNQKDYLNFIKMIKEKIYKSQYDTLKIVNKNIINLYIDIGKEITEKQEELGWGKSVVNDIASKLQKEFPGIKGFSSANLWRMRNFYITYKSNEKLAPLVREISWTKNLLIMEKCKNDLEKEFYIKMTKRYGWTKNVLVHQIENDSYEKFLINQTNFENNVPEKYRYQAKLAVKDEYTFDFLELDKEHSESELEKNLIKNIRNFLIEMGGYFTFIGNQYRIEIDDQEFFIDVLLYHRKLRSLVAIELKIGEFKPEHTGKMQFYLSILDEQVKLESENPSIGIIICKSKNRTIVEYALKETTKPIGVSTYKISKILPDDMKNLIPSAEEIAKRLNSINIDEL